ncbi:hypothetical protein Tcan_05247 [Toxocara canis]|uniref:Uncharacterized protein n=1 Tax=Toxocara canis TaxID=6265 RepID=A0A0B2V1U7_TOXCA|nr:hypothetical protein Tcan_05247 [Toxocara canis]
MSFDAEIEVPSSSAKPKSHHPYDKPSQHHKHIVTESDNHKKVFDEKLRKKHEYNKPKVLENDVENSRIYQRLSTTVKASASSRSRATGGYDIPKDTINEAVIRKNEHCQPSPSCSPSKQPLLPADKQHSKTQRSPPPTIVLSPPDEQSTEKVKVIFEYDREKGKMKLVDDDEQTPNFLIRNKKPILISAFVLLLFLLLSISIVIIYALNSQP